MKTENQSNDTAAMSGVDSSAMFDVGLSDAERERLAVLMEECAEVQQIIGKILRHGYDSKHPNRMRPQDPDNREMLAEEIGHVDAAIKLMVSNRDVSLDGIKTYRRQKEARIGRYLHFQSNDKVDHE